MFKRNNPLNLRPTIKSGSVVYWKGQTGVDNNFCVFDTPENGLRAAIITLKTYIKNGHNTIAKIITRWAPSSENDTNSYVSFVSNKVGLAYTLKVIFEKEFIRKLVWAMGLMEQGKTITSEMFETAWKSI